MKRLQARSRDFLRDRLGAGHPALPFAEAVVAQVAHPLGDRGGEGRHRESRLAQRVVDLLLACERPGGEPSAVGRLSADPPLLSAFFQNVDLLYAHAYPHADVVSMLTLEALHHAGEAENR